MFYLDTNTCIYFLNGTHPAVRQHLLACRPAEIIIPAIVKAELLYGALRSQRRDENLETVHQFLQPFSVVEFGDAESIHYAEIRRELERHGRPIGPNDLIIASVARANGATLVTHNMTGFQRVPQLSVVDWTMDGDIGAT